MLKSNYNNKPTLTLGEELKKKLLKKQQDENAPSTEEIDAEVQGNKPAISKEQADKSLEFQDQGYKFSSGLQGNYVPTEKLDVPIDSESSGNWGSGSTGAKTASAATGALGMAATVMGNKGPMTKRERKANTMNLTSQGAAAGSAFGPWGTLIGAGVGLGTGLIQGIGDEKELEDKAKLERVAYLDDSTEERKRAQKLDEGKKVLEKNKNVLQAQMGLLGSKYSQSKIG